MSNNLIISIKGASSKDNKHAINIDKKIKKIEQLKKQNQKIIDTIAIAKKLFNTHCKEKEDKLLNIREQFLIALYKRYQQKGFSRWQKEMMESKLMNDIDELFSLGYESKILFSIQEDINKHIEENRNDFEKEMMNEMTIDVLRSMGVNVDEEDFNFENFKNSDYREQFQEKYSEQYAKDYQEFHENNKDQKDKEQQEKVKKTSSDFYKLYKSLVKKVHPDLVIDAKAKEIREEWMKRLSQAWEERNYYELLLLQKEIDSDNSIDVALNESQVKYLISELNKEIKKLEANKYMLKRHDPETAFYFENFNAKSEKGILKKIMEHKGFVEFKIGEIEEEKESLKTQKSTKELLLEIRDSIEDIYDDPYDYIDIFEE